MPTDMSHLLTVISDLQRRVSSMVRHGVVHEVEKGRIRIAWGKETKQGVEEGQQKPFLSPWIRTANHSGFATEHVPFVKGQTVTSISMDPDHLTATVMPYSDSEFNPMDGEASTEAHTYRIRKPPTNGPQAAQGGPQALSAGAGASGGDSGADDPPKRQDDEDDFKVKRDYNGMTVSAGKDVTLSVTRSGITMKFGNQEVVLNGEGFKMKTKSFTGEKAE